MNNNSRPRSLSVGGGPRNRQYIPETIPPEMAHPLHHFPASPSFPFTSRFPSLHPDPFDDVLRSLATTYTTDPLPPQHHYYPPPQADESSLLGMPPHQQLDPTTLAWLQLLQSQGPAQHDLGVGSSSKGQGGTQEQSGRQSAQPTHLPSDPADPDEDEDSEAERAVTAEDKRRRNTAASARFRSKKKQWLLNMERTVTSLSRQVDELEREAADLRRENGWLKEIVMLRARRAIGGGPLNLSGSLVNNNNVGQPDAVRGKKRQQ